MQMVNLNFLKQIGIIKIAIVCAYLVCVSLCLFILLNNNGDFFLNLYFIPLLGFIGAVIFKKIWYITPAIIFTFSMIIRGEDFGIQIGIICMIAALIGSLVAILTKFSMRGGVTKRKALSVVLRIFSAILAIILTLATLGFANIFVGNPITKLIADLRVKKYLSIVYPGSTVDESGYNFKDTDYYFYYTIDDTQRSVYYQNKKIYDTNVSEYYKDKLSKLFIEIKQLVGDEEVSLSADTFTYIMADGDYSTDFDKLHTEIALYLHLNNKKQDISENERKEIAATLIKQVADAANDGYNIIRISGHYKDIFGSYDYKIDKKSINSYDAILECLE